MMALCIPPVLCGSFAARNIDKANSILGMELEVAGEIVKGDQRGRELGYPTANVKMHDVIHPAYGIYAFVQIEGEAGWRMAAVNIGIRPMFALKDAQLEAHILDFDADIYGKQLRIMPVKRLRSEAKFDSLYALIAQWIRIAHRRARYWNAKARRYE